MKKIAEHENRLNALNLDAINKKLKSLSEEVTKKADKSMTEQEFKKVNESITKANDWLKKLEDLIKQIQSKMSTSGKKSDSPKGVSEF